MFLAKSGVLLPLVLHRKHLLSIFAAVISQTCVTNPLLNAPESKRYFKNLAIIVLTEFAHFRQYTWEINDKAEPKLLLRSQIGYPQ